MQDLGLLFYRIGHIMLDTRHGRYLRRSERPSTIALTLSGVRS